MISGTKWSLDKLFPLRGLKDGCGSKWDKRLVNWFLNDEIWISDGSAQKRCKIISGA